MKGAVIKGVVLRVPVVLIAALLLAVFTMLVPALTGPATAAVADTPGPAQAPEYWFDQWKVENLWNQGARGQGITIAEIDTGVNGALPELNGRLVPGHDFNGGGDGTTDRDDGQLGHGTAMASIMVGGVGPLGTEGVAPSAKVMPLAISLDDTQYQGDGGDEVPAAIDWAVDHGAKIVNLSLGLDEQPQDDQLTCEQDKQAAIFRALSRGVIVVASSGNDGPTTNTIVTPGACLGVISVGAVDAKGVVANFSSRHPYLSVTAPGVDIASLGKQPGTAWNGDGTSQAAALTSAALALVWSKYPALTGAQITSRLMSTLTGRRAVASAAYGYGRVDPYSAITGSVPSSATNPVTLGAQPFLRRYLAISSPAPLAAPVLPTGVPAPAGSPRRLATAWLDESRVSVGLRAVAVGLFALLVIGGLGLVSSRQRRRGGAPPG